MSAYQNSSAASSCFSPPVTFRSTCLSFRHHDLRSRSFAISWAIQLRPLFSTLHTSGIAPLSYALQRPCPTRLVLHYRPSPARILAIRSRSVTIPNDACRHATRLVAHLSRTPVWCHCLVGSPAHWTQHRMVHHSFARLYLLAPRTFQLYFLFVLNSSHD